MSTLSTPWIITTIGRDRFFFFSDDQRSFGFEFRIGKEEAAVAERPLWGPEDSEVAFLVLISRSLVALAATIDPRAAAGASGRVSVSAGGGGRLGGGGFFVAVAAVGVCPPLLREVEASPLRKAEMPVSSS